MEEKKYTLELEGRTLEVVLNSWAEQAHGSAIVRLGDTTVLATAVMIVAFSGGSGAHA